ncbi:MAG: MATE family efflux transporter [Gammaproteobacteria bacterium]|nr:MAG: MATE family efflux transporter [Gammaproteobacteria bacterium]
MPSVNSAQDRGPLTHRAITKIALPVMIANISTPLIGVVDTAVVGQIPDPAYIGAVAVGSLIFSFAFWAFGFLRMGTTGLTAQAFGARENDEVSASLGRALLIALAAGTALIALQWPIREIAFGLLAGSEQVEFLARGYFDIRIWAAPATLANYALLGWLIGLGRTDIGLVLQLVLNLTNIALDALFFLGFGWDVRGVAFGTVLAEWSAAGIGLMIAIRHLRRFGGLWSLERLLAVDRLRRTMSVNGDIMIRSLALIFVFVWFMAQGARQGDVILAANAVLMHLISISAFFLDGLAFAAEALVGRAVGAAHRAGLVAAARMTTLWAGAVALFLSLVIGVLGAEFIDLLTVDASARSAARTYLPWAIGMPLLGVWAFQLDGIFIGATRTVEMRNAMLISLLIFLIAWWLSLPLGNHGLWVALYINYLARIGTLYYHYPALVRSVPDGR